MRKLHEHLETSLARNYDGHNGEEDGNIMTVRRVRQGLLNGAHMSQRRDVRLSGSFKPPLLVHTEHMKISQLISLLSLSTLL